MERDSSQDKDSLQETKADQEGAGRDNGESLKDGTYQKCRDLWQRYLQGEITADELQRNLGQYDEEIEEIKDFFDGEEI